MMASKPCWRFTPSERQSVQTSTWASSRDSSSIFIFRSSSASRLVTIPTATFLYFFSSARCSAMYLPTYSAVCMYWQKTMGFIPLLREKRTISNACLTFSSLSVALMSLSILIKSRNLRLSELSTCSNASGTTSSLVRRSFRGSLKV